MCVCVCVGLWGVPGPGAPGIGAGSGVGGHAAHRLEGALVDEASVAPLSVSLDALILVVGSMLQCFPHRERERFRVRSITGVKRVVIDNEDFHLDLQPLKAIK